MMKEKIKGLKWIGIVLAGVMLSGVLFYFLVYEVKIDSLESLVSDNAFYYLSSSNINKKIEYFQSTPFFQQLCNLEVYKKFIDPELKKLRQKMPLLTDVTEKEIGIAVFSPSDIRDTRSDLADTVDLLMLARLDKKKYLKAKKELLKFYLAITQKDKISSQKYGGIKIINAKLPDLKSEMNYAFLSDVLVISNNIEVIKKSIDLMKKKSRDSLMNHQDFQKVTAKIKKDGLFWGYQNIKNYYQEMLRRYTYSSLKSEQATGVQAADSLVKMKYFVNLMNVLKTNVFYLDYDELKNGLVSKFYCNFDKSKDEEGLLDIIAYKKNIDRDTLNLIPSDIIAYFGYSQDFPKYWDFLKRFFLSFSEMIKAQINANPRYDPRYKERINQMDIFGNFLKGFASFSGVDMEKDILPLLDNDFALVFARLDDLDIPLPDAPQINPEPLEKRSFAFFFPQPYFLFELKDESQMRTIMETLTQNIVDKVNNLAEEQRRKFQEEMASQEPQDNQKKQPVVKEEEIEVLRLQRDSHRGVDIYRFELSDFPIDLIKPSYCILDKYLILSLSPPLIEKVIEIYKSKRRSLTLNFIFDSLEDELSPDYFNVIFFDFKRLVDNFKLTKVFNNLQTQLADNPPKNFSSADLETILNLLGNFSTLTATYRLSNDETIEASISFKVKGL